MFRPYNLTSITAWTVGCLAGNRAYYETRARTPRIKSSRHTRTSGRESLREPACLRSLQRKLERISEEMLALSPRSALVQCRDVVKFCFYADWFVGCQEALKQEVSAAHEMARDQGYFLDESETQDAQDRIDAAVVETRKRRDTLDSQMYEGLRQLPNYETNISEVNLVRRKLRVCETSFKLIEDRTAAPRNQRKRSAPPPPPTAPEPKLASRDLYLSRGQETFGPYRYPQLLEWLSSGQVLPDDLVAYDGAPSWVAMQALFEAVEAESN